MPVPLIVVAIIEAGAVIAARKVAQELAKKAATELAKKAAAEAAKKAAAEAAKKAATEAAKKAATEATKKAASQTAKTAAKRPNTPLNSYLDKAKKKLSDACKKAVEKFDAHIHGKKGDVIKQGSGKESHHIFQNAQFEDERGGGSSLCSNYTTSAGPAVPAGGEKHKSVSRDQRAIARTQRRSGEKPTYDQARRQSRKQMRMLGASRAEAECLMKFADQVMEQLCPGVIKAGQSNPVVLRTPG